MPNTTSTGKVFDVREGQPASTLELLSKVSGFVSGTELLTNRGYVPVQDIVIGDQLVSGGGESEALLRVLWVGKCSVRAVDNAGILADAGFPVRIIRDAIDDGVPSRDVVITSGQPIYVDGQRIPVRMLVNDMSIFYDDSFTAYDFYHIETALHSIVSANGLLSETYLDAGHRACFSQDGKVVALPRSRKP